MEYLSISDIVRPRGNRDEAGAKGEILHQFADVLKKHFPKVRVQHDMSKDELLPFVAGLQVSAEYRLLKSNSLRIFAGAPGTF